MEETDHDAALSHRVAAHREAVERREMLRRSQVHERAHSQAVESASVGGVSEVWHQQGEICRPNENGFRVGEEVCKGGVFAPVVDLTGYVSDEEYTKVPAADDDLESDDDYSSSDGEHTSDDSDDSDDEE